MPVPVAQMATVASYVVRQKLAGRKRYPLVLMLEPLYLCNLACAGCGKIQYPKHVLQRRLSVEECMRAVDECGAPVVSLPGGEPATSVGWVVRTRAHQNASRCLLLYCLLSRYLLQPSRFSLMC